MNDSMQAMNYYYQQVEFDGLVSINTHGSYDEMESNGVGDSELSTCNVLDEDDDDDDELGRLSLK